MNFNNNEFTLLSDEQTFGSQQIDVIKKMGGKCAISDFAILLGAYVSSDYHVDGDNSMRGRTGWWYLSSSDGDGDVRDVNKDGDRKWTNAGKRSGAVRPDSLLKKFFKNLKNRVVKYILGKVYQIHKVKEFYSFLTILKCGR